MRIERWDPRRDGPFSQTALHQKLQSRGYQPILRVLPIGAVAAGQPDDRDRAAAVITGVVKLSLDSDSAILAEGDVAFFPVGVPWRLEVIGATGARCFEAVSLG
jgi:glyoxylate utilization-related uncharacterized protein